METTTVHQASEANLVKCYVEKMVISAREVMLVHENEWNWKWNHTTQVIYVVSSTPCSLLTVSQKANGTLKIVPQSQESASTSGP